MTDRVVEDLKSKWFTPTNNYVCSSFPVHENIFKKETYAKSPERRKFLPLVLWRPTLLYRVRFCVREEVSFYKRRTSVIQQMPATSLLTYNPLLPYIFKFASTGELPQHDMLYYLETFFGNPFIDRTRTLLRCAKVKVIDPIPKINMDFSMTLHEVCIERAQEILKISKERKQQVKVLWSGGIDSTAVVVSLLLCCSKSEMKSITVIYTDESVQEYPLFYNILTQRGVRLQKMLQLDYLYEKRRGEPDFFVVTGEHGDQIFGSMVMKNCFEEEVDFPPVRKVSPNNIFAGRLWSPWKEFFRELLIEYQIAPKSTIPAMIRWMEKQVNHSPFQIRTVFDWLWWINFSLKWQHVGLRIVLMQTERSVTRREMLDRTIHFFSSEAFQQWSFHNHDKKLPGPDWASYKWPLKQFIFTYTQDAEYRDTKKKVPSLRESKPGSRLPPLGLDENVKAIQFGRHSICLDDLIETYGNNFQSCLVSDEDLQGQTTVGCDPMRIVLKPVKMRYNASWLHTHGNTREDIYVRSRRSLRFGDCLGE